MTAPKNIYSEKNPQKIKCGKKVVSLCTAENSANLFFYFKSNYFKSAHFILDVL